MKKITTTILVAIVFASCQNSGDKNQSSVKVREADSSVKVNQPVDAAGSSGRNDTATTPLQLHDTAKAGNSTKADSTGSKSQSKSGKGSDSTKRK